MFVCLSCGHATAVPTPDCPELVLTDYMGLKIRMPCHAWPMSPEEYIGRRMLEEGSEAYFSGVVVLPEGHFEVSTHVPAALGRELAVRAVEKDLTTSEAIARKRKETREIVMNQVVSGTVPSIFNEVNKLLGEPQAPVTRIKGSMAQQVLEAIKKDEY